MSIIVTCSNGHRLSAPDKRAGTTGHCPACGVEVHIPELKKAPPSDSSILRILGIGQELRKRLAEEEANEKTVVEEQAFLDENVPKKKERHTKLCPQCDWEIDADYKICPKCRFYFME